MSNEKNQSSKQSSDNDSATKPDPETLHTTDPQEHMKGPLSSLMQGAGDGFDEEGSGDSEKKQNS